MNSVVASESVEAIAQTMTAHATLDAWRERGAHRLDPVRFRLIEALERRASRYQGTARRVLDDRLAGLIHAYALKVEQAEAQHARPLEVELQSRSARSALAALVDDMHAQAQRDGRDTAPRGTPAMRNAQRESEILEYFREIWSRINTASQLRQLPSQVPENAGPLNTHKLVYRSLVLMRALSPEYLQHFLGHVDALSWMQQLVGETAPPKKDAVRTVAAKKATRSKRK